MTGKWSLVLAGRYSEAIAEYEHALLRGSCSVPELMEFVSLTIATGDYHRAIELACRAEALDSLVRPADWGPSSLFPVKVGLAQLLTGDTHSALETLGTATTIGYRGDADLALLFHYASLRDRNKVASDRARRHLQHEAKLARGRYWPGPLQAMLVGLSTIEAVCAGQFGEGNPLRLLTIAAPGSLTRRQAVQALFHVGVRYCWEGRLPDARHVWSLCANAANPVLSAEWYLARAQLEHGYDLSPRV